MNGSAHKSNNNRRDRHGRTAPNAIQLPKRLDYLFDRGRPCTAPTFDGTNIQASSRSNQPVTLGKT